MRRALVVLGVILCVVVSTMSTSSALTRSQQDRADKRTGSQIHFIYAVARDGTDRHLDTDGTVERTVRTLSKWFAGQTGAKSLRVDAYRRSVDVTFRRLSLTEAEYSSYGGWTNTHIQWELEAAGFNMASKSYAVLYDGPHPLQCGAASWPPAFPGRMTVLFLQGTPPGSPPCASNVLGGATPGYWEFAITHDVLHTLGFVATCAPNEYRGGHVSDARNDLMWAGDQPWVFPPVLDVGRDDYFKHGRTDCPDLNRSGWLMKSWKWR
jgi:hypothetical protein